MGVAVSIVCTAILLGIVFYAGYRKQSVHVAFGTAACLGVIFLFIPALPSLAAYFSLLLVVLLGIPASLLRVRMQTFTVWAVCAAVGMHGYYIVKGRNVLKRREQLRAQLPYRSLADRLAYEPIISMPTEKSAVPAAARPVVLSSEAARSLVQLDDDWRLSHRRGDALKFLHQSYHDEFAATAGFGFMRMSPLTRYPERYIDLPPDVPIPQPTLEEMPVYENIAPMPPLLEADAEQTGIPNKDSLTSIHHASYIDFSNAAGFGDVQDREHVAGFQSHHFGSLPTLPNQHSTGDRWRLARLELVSLLKHEQPDVYISENLPRMEELRDAPTRPLNAFEQRALEQVAAGEDLVIESTLNEIRMLGALRAAKQCLECHRVQRGELLGAFSYRLIRDPQLPAAPPANDLGLSHHESVTAIEEWE